MRLTEIIQRGWDAFNAGDFDAVVADYTEDMILIMPGQDDILSGRQAFRTVLDGISSSLPPGFAVTGLRNIEGEDEVVSIVEWKSDKVASSQLIILFKFKCDKIFEERWFIDTEQWKSAF